MNRKLVFSVMLIGMLVFGLVLVSCGNETSKLAGIWVSEDETMELSKDGTFRGEGISGTWSAGNNHLNLTALGGLISISADYKLSGSTLTVTSDGETTVYKKKK